METTAFINNAVLLLGLGILSTYLRYRWVKEFKLKEFILGVLYGLFTVIAMSRPMTLTPGAFFDGRSIILGLAGLFETPLVVFVAVLMGGAYRVYLGGIGTFIGVGSMVISAGMGILFKQMAGLKKIRLNPGTLFLLGFSIHLLLLLWFFNFPRELALQIIRTISFPYLVIFSITTMLIGLFILSQNQRLIAEQNLVESEKKYRLLVDTMLEGLWMVDTKMVTTFVNPAMSELMGYTPQEMIGQKAQNFLNKKDFQRVENFFERRKQGNRDKYDLTYVRKDGKTIQVSLNSVPLFNESGEFAGSLAAVQDITERKRAERQLALQSRHLEETVEERTQDLKRAQEQLIHAERMATLGELAGSVGHELRNPLAVIRNSIYLLKSKNADKDKRNEYINLIEQETINASRIITELLDYSNIQPQKPMLCEVADLVNEVIERNPPPKNVEILANISRDHPKLFVNPSQVSQILANLVSNAYDAMPTGGSLEFSSRSRENQVVILLKDTGKGIPKKDLQRIFEPLFTSKPRGIGLGLAIARRLADLNNVEITVKSQPGKGSTFELYLPTRVI